MSSKTLAVLFLCLVSIIFEITDGVRFNRTAYQFIMRGRSEFLPPERSSKASSKGDNASPYIALQNKYDELQNQHYSNAVKLIMQAQQNAEGFQEMEGACFHCQKLGGNKIACFVDCMTEKLQTFQSYSGSISQAISMFFCKPLGFKFLERYLSASKKSPKLSTFTEFVEKFFADLESFGAADMAEFWLSNVLLMQQSPLHFHAALRASMMSTIIGSDTYEQTNVQVDSLSPTSFAALCDSTFATDIIPEIYTLISAAKDKSDVLDIILRGLFVTRSAAFYTPGRVHQPLAAGILEVMNAIIGTNCNVLAYAEGRSAKGCDQIGKFPVPNFPYPKSLKGLAPTCE